MMSGSFHDGIYGSGAGGGGFGAGGAFGQQLYCSHSYSHESRNQFPRIPIRINESSSNLTADHFNYFDMEEGCFE